MGNVFPFFGPRKNTAGNCISVPLFSDFAANPFTGPVPLTSDLEPDRSGYFPIPALLTGNLFANYVSFQLLLLTRNLFEKNYFMTK